MDFLSLIMFGELKILVLKNKIYYNYFLYIHESFKDKF